MQNVESIYISLRSLQIVSSLHPPTHSALLPLELPNLEINSVEQEHNRVNEMNIANLLPLSGCNGRNCWYLHYYIVDQKYLFRQGGGEEVASAAGVFRLPIFIAPLLAY